MTGGKRRLGPGARPHSEQGPWGQQGIQLVSVVMDGACGEHNLECPPGPGGSRRTGEQLRAEAPVRVSQLWLKGQVGHLAYGEETTRDAVGEVFNQPVASACIFCEAGKAEHLPRGPC